MLREAAQQALEALQNCANGEDDVLLTRDALAALRAALVEPVQEPVAIVGTQEDTWKGYGSQWLSPGPPIKTVHMLAELPVGTPLYAAPPQRKPLTEEEIQELSHQHKFDSRMEKFVRIIEQAHGIV